MQKKKRKKKLLVKHFESFKDLKNEANISKFTFVLKFIWK